MLQVTVMRSGKFLNINDRLIEPKQIYEVNEDESNQETFLDKVEQFIRSKEISARPLTIQNYSTSLNTYSKPLHYKQLDAIIANDVQLIINNLITKELPL